jgi:hypothetical protein
VSELDPARLFVAALVDQARKHRKRSPEQGAIPCKVCADCEGPLYGWSADTKKVIYRDLPIGRSRVRVRHLDSGRDDVLVEQPKYAITLPARVAGRGLDSVPDGGEPDAAADLRGAPAVGAPLSNRAGFRSRMDARLTVMRSGRLMAAWSTFSPNGTDSGASARSGWIPSRSGGQATLSSYSTFIRRADDFHRTTSWC